MTRNCPTVRSTVVHMGPDTNIYFRGFTKDGRPIYMIVEKATGIKKRLVLSKTTYAAMNRILRDYPERTGGDPT